MDFPFPENHDRSGRLDGCLGDPDDHPTEPAYDADSRPGSVCRRDLSPAGNLAGPRTAAVSDSLYKLLSEDERILSVTSFIGTSSPRFQATYAPNLAGKNYAQFIVNTASVEAT